MLRPLVIAVCLAAAPALAAAQTVAPANTPLKGEATHTGLGVSGFQLYVDDAKVGKPVPTSLLSPGGTIPVDIPGLAPGPHKLELAAVYPWTEAKSGPLLVQAIDTTPPGTLTITFTFTVTATGTASTPGTH